MIGLALTKRRLGAIASAIAPPPTGAPRPELSAQRPELSAQSAACERACVYTYGRSSLRSGYEAAVLAAPSCRDLCLKRNLPAAIFCLKRNLPGADLLSDKESSGRDLLSENESFGRGSSGRGGRGRGRKRGRGRGQGRGHAGSQVPAGVGSAARRDRATAAGAGAGWAPHPPMRALRGRKAANESFAGPQSRQ